VKAGQPEWWDEFIEWIVTPEREGTQTAWAKAHGVPVAEVSRCQKRAGFRQKLEKRYAQLNISPDRLQQVVQAMHAKAAKGDTQAAKLYLEYVRQLEQTRDVAEDVRVDDMSDDELAAALQRAASAVSS
jgi:hypothetical protein